MPQQIQKTTLHPQLIRQNGTKATKQLCRETIRRLIEEPETQFKLAVNTKNETGQSLKADKQNKIND